MNSHIKGEIKLLVVVLSILFALFVVVLFYCYFIKSDYKGVITNLQENNFTLEPINADEEAEYSVYKIFFNEDTKISGKGTAVDDLEATQQIKVWVEEINESMVANEINITNQAIISLPDITLEDVIAAITKQGFELKEADLPSRNAFIQELNGISPSYYYLEGDVLSIYTFPTIAAREKGIAMFEEMNAAADVVDHKEIVSKNILIFYEMGTEKTATKLNNTIKALGKEN
ncbi:hypothetical protein [Aquibacillus kalidii]|uniref:hypothetical protein n=1 Tax=Aquibacillus kalidii TaxID=2762597 RepID=UPI0016449462|nr:hypothetical protein [Aquibacillus kalidii]